MTTQHTGIGWEMQACGWHLDAGDWKVITISQGGVTLQQVGAADPEKVSTISLEQFEQEFLNFKRQ